MNFDPRKPAVLLTTVLLLGAFGAPVCAQQKSSSATPAEESLEDAAEKLFTSIADKRQEIRKLRVDIAAAAGEDRVVLEGRAMDKAQELISDVRALADNVIAREQDGQDASADRQRLEEMLQEFGPIARDHLAKLNAAVVDLKVGLDEANPETRLKIGDRVGEIEKEINETLKACLELEQTKEVLGLDAEKDRQYVVEALRDRAELLAGRIATGQEKVLNVRGRARAAPEDSGLAAELQSAQKYLDRNIASLDLTIRMMDTLGMDSAQYKQLLFQATGEITTHLLSREVIAGLANQWAKKVVEWLTGNGPRLFFKVVIFLLILLVFRILAKIARRLVKKSIGASSLEVSQLLERTAVSVTGSLVMLFGFLVALSQLGVQVGPMLAGLGVAGFIAGFALQDTLGNFASGVMILLYRPYDVGDLIETAGAYGKVSDMSLVATTILTLDHQTLVVPNSKIWGDVIKNVTAQKIRRVDMVFSISYSDDIPKTEQVLQEIVAGHEMVLDDPEPIIRLHALGESSVDFVVRPWAKTVDYWDVYWDITREVKMRFDAEQISIPFPQRDIHLFAQDPPKEKAPEAVDSDAAADQAPAPEQPVGRGESEDDV